MLVRSLALTALSLIAVAVSAAEDGAPDLVALPPASEVVEAKDAAPSAPVQPVTEAPKASPAADVPDAEKGESARTAIDRMRDVLTRMLKHLEDARNERDVIKLNCVNEKLTAVKGLLKIAEQADVSLQEALSKRDGEASGHEFEKIMIASRKCDQLSAESEACVGELSVYAGDTQVEVVVDDMPEQDPTGNTGTPFELTRPPAASPFQ